MNINIFDEIYEKLKLMKNKENKKINLISEMLSYKEWYKELDNDIIFDMLIYLGFEKNKALDILKEIVKIKVY